MLLPSLLVHFTGQCSLVAKCKSRHVWELLQQQVDYVTDLYDTLCPEWMNVYEWIGDKSLVDHATNALCTSIGEESQEQLKADYSAVSSTSDVWLLFALSAKMRLWFLWEFGRMMSFTCIICPSSHRNQSLILVSADRSHRSGIR